MKVLSKEELKKAEEELRHYFPQSQQVYGYVCLINRVKADPIDVLVDQWPDFSVLLIRPQLEETTDLCKDICIFAKDETSLKRILIKMDIFNWKQYLCVDLCYMEMIQRIAVNCGMPDIKTYPSHQLILQDPSNLTTERLNLQVSTLNESHVALVNRTWKYSMGIFSERYIRNMIRNFPSYCVLDSEGRPVSWILTYTSCAVGMLYTLPEHRRKGYAKALVTILAKKLHSEGYPVFCFIEFGNEPSIRLFRSLGFTEDPSYTVIWFECPQAQE